MDKVNFSTKGTRCGELEVKHLVIFHKASFVNSHRGSINKAQALWKEEQGKQIKFC